MASWHSGQVLLAVVPAAPLCAAANVAPESGTALEAPGMDPPLQACRSGTMLARILIVDMLTMCEPIAWKGRRVVGGGWWFGGW